MLYVGIGLLACYALLLGLAGLKAVLRSVRLRRLGSLRTSDSFETFREQFENPPISDDDLREVYETVALDLVGIRGFPVRADDNVFTMYGAWPELIDTVLRDLTQRSGRIFPGYREILRTMNIVRVRDIVDFLASCPLAQTVERRSA